MMQHFINGVGSVINIAPPPNFERFVPTKSIEQTLHDDFQRIASDMQHVMGQQHVKSQSQ